MRIKAVAQSCAVVELLQERVDKARESLANEHGLPGTTKAAIQARCYFLERCETALLLMRSHAAPMVMVEIDI